jgi:D,D-heptose 1,7-bisphosphate phosphatase
MQAIILAGGRGTRLGDITREIPKPMIFIGNKPLLHHQVDLLVKYGIRDIIILVNYLKDPILSHFGDGSRFDAHIRYFEEDAPLGTVGGIKEIESWLTEDFLVLYGDVMINMDLNRLIAFHHTKNSQCTLVLHPNDHPFDSDLVETDTADRIVAFHPKPHDPDTWYHNLVNAGVYILSPHILSFLNKGKKADFGRDIFPNIFSQVLMFGYRTTEYLKDMGTPDRLEKVISDLESGRMKRHSYEQAQKAIFMDRDGVINIERSYIIRPEELELYDFTYSAVRKINQAGYLSIVVTNQSAIARNLCTDADVQNIHRKMETLLAQRQAWLDAVYYCPHHPHKGFPEENPSYKIDCDCRKPKTGLFKRAIEHFNISAEESYMIGDSERDIQAGINTGCVTIGVRTGYGIKKTRVFPDYMFSNLAEAVDFIVEDPYLPVFDRIFQQYVTYQGKMPWIILIGGNARTGKSTLATYLRLGFTRKGHKTIHIGLDNWLMPEEQRTPDMGVYDRFCLARIEKDLPELIYNGKILNMFTYVNHPERQSLPVTYDSAGAAIVIVDGVVALSSPKIRKLAHLSLFTTLDSSLFRMRIEEYYIWRGKSAAETAALFKKRKKDEYQLIEKERKFADQIINPFGS